MSQPRKAESTATKLRANESKWGVPLVKAGWTMIPSTILEQQDALGLDPVDMNILLQLARHWWRADNPPRPAIATIAKCISKSVSTVQRRIKRLEREGLIEIEHRFDDKHGAQLASNYRFTGLIRQATEFAQEALKEKLENRTKKATRLGQTLPPSPGKLKIVRGKDPA